MKNHSKPDDHRQKTPEDERTTAGRRIGLVGCVKQKRDEPAKARDLYVSPLFRGRRRYVEESCDRWLILSAQHGVLDPLDTVAPYDRTLKSASRAERRAWTAQVLDELERRLGNLAGTTFEIHAGAEYRDSGLVAGLAARGADVSIPVLGLALGQQLQFYARPRESPAETDASTGPETAVAAPGPDAKRTLAAARSARGGYDALRDDLAARYDRELTLSFAGIEAIIGRPLPASARRHRPWWSNSTAGHTHARAWVEAGWRVTDLDLETGQVTFRRQPASGDAQP